MIAGPSEILVLADGTTPADWVAMDLFSQAEHDELAQSVALVSGRQLHRTGAAPDRPPAAGDAARGIIAQSLNGRGALIRAASRRKACEISNHASHRAPGDRRRRSAPLGAAAAPRGYPWAPAIAGRLLRRAQPRAAWHHRALLQPLGVYDFQKRSSLIEVSEAGAQVLGTIAAELAYGENLQAHARAAECD